MPSKKQGIINNNNNNFYNLQDIVENAIAHDQKGTFIPRFRIRLFDFYSQTLINELAIPFSMHNSGHW